MQKFKNPAVKISPHKHIYRENLSRLRNQPLLKQLLKDIHEVLPVLTVVRAVCVDSVVAFVGGGLVVLEDVCVASWIISLVFDAVMVVFSCVMASGVGLVWLWAGTRVPTATGCLKRGVLAGLTVA